MLAARIASRWILAELEACGLDDEDREVLLQMVDDLRELQLGVRP